MVWLSQMASSPQTGEEFRGLRLSRRIGITILNLEPANGVVHRIEHGQIITALFRRAVDKSLGVYFGIALIGGDLVVQVGGGISPVPLGDHHIALNSLRPRRRLRR